MGHLGELYGEGRARFLDVVDGADPDTPVPTCPAWTVRNVLSHVTGICADILAGRLDGVATDPWTAAQVDARRDRPIDDIAAEWRETGPQIDAMVDAFGRTGEQLLLDLTTHEFDVRHAVARPGPTDLEVWDIGADFVTTMVLDSAIRECGLPAIEVRAGKGRWIAGDGDAAGTLTASPFELSRAVTGRRSARQVAALGWSIDPAPYLPALERGIFRFSTADVLE